jgi:hypothetical protein
MSQRTNLRTCAYENNNFKVLMSVRCYVQKNLTQILPDYNNPVYTIATQPPRNYVREMGLFTNVPPITDRTRSTTACYLFHSFTPPNVVLIRFFLLKT